MSNDQTPSNPICTIDPFKFLELKLNQDGTITRLAQPQSTPASSDPKSPSLVLTKDFPLNLNNKTFLRLFLPKLALNPSFSSKLRLIVYFHGGGFVFHHADSTIFHNFCSEVATFTSSMVVSVEYRLAPEHRLPAAYDDALEALHWIRASYTKENVSVNSVHDHEWLAKYGDCSKCFLMGSGAGGNIAYHLRLRALKFGQEMGPLRIPGLMLHQPFFRGLVRTKSEFNLIEDCYVPLSANDLFWELSLPSGADRDHEYSNLKSGDGPALLDRVKELGWRVLVTGCSGDPLVDRQVELVKLLEDKDVVAQGYFTEGDYHAVEIFDRAKCNSFPLVVKDFIYSC